MSYSKTGRKVPSAGSRPSGDPCSFQLESDALSASVNIEDIIEDYDGLSMKSKSASFISFLNKQHSQSYFSLTNKGEEEEATSFCTALQDSFSLAENVPGISEDCGQPPLWSTNDSAEGESMLNRQDFQVFWSDIVYNIAPKMTMSSIWHDFSRLVRSNLGPARETLGLRADTIRSKNSVENRCEQPITILQQIDGSFKSGELTAVIGPSGAGKTSLLNFLSRRREEGYSGQLLIDNANRRIKISTIPQHDHLPEYLSVRENLIFASRLKNTQKNYDHIRNVEKVGSLLGLDDCLETKTKKISGGQHKRLAIAQELLSRPDILILDEPTSGLDSLTCYKTLSVLKDLVRSSARRLIDPIAIVLTIHQPEQEVFDIFDKVYVLANGGVAIYDGTPEECTDFIERHSTLIRPDTDYNPASFLIEIASGEYGREPIEALQNQIRIQARENLTLQRISMKQKHISKNAFASSTSQESKISAYESKGAQLSGEIHQKTLLYIDHRIAKGSTMNKGNFWLKTRILSERCWISILRDPKQMIARILFHILFPIGLGLMMGTEPGRANACPKYSSQYNLMDLVASDNQTDEDVQEELLLTLENIALLFVLIYALISANVGATTLSFTLDMQSSLKEFHNGWYSMSSYILARLITDIPMSIFLPTICIAIGYPFTGQMAHAGHGISDSYRALITALAIIFGSNVAQTMGMIFGAIYIGHVTTALFASQGASLPFVFLSGFVIRTKKMSKFVYTLSTASFYRHTLDIASIARYGFNICNCDPKEISGNDTELVGVPDGLKSFTEYWLISMSGGTSDLNSTGNSGDTNKNIFQMFAKQISLYNTYGMEIKSCNDVIPYQLYDLSLSEKDLPGAFLALAISMVVMELLLLVTVKLVIRYRTSL